MGGLAHGPHRERGFSDLEWERSLGWLNIKAERRASTAMRWVRYGVIVLLVDALVILYWAAEGLAGFVELGGPVGDGGTWRCACR